MSENEVVICLDCGVPMFQAQGLAVKDWILFCDRCPQPSTNNGKPMPAKTRRGRPPRGGTRRRFAVVMTDAEHDALKAHAASQGLTVAELIRSIAPPVTAARSPWDAPKPGS